MNLHLCAAVQFKNFCAAQQISKDHHLALVYNSHFPQPGSDSVCNFLSFLTCHSREACPTRRRGSGNPPEHLSGTGAKKTFIAGMVPAFAGMTAAKVRKTSNRDTARSRGVAT